MKPLVTYRCRRCSTKLAYIEKGEGGPTLTYREHIRKIRGGYDYDVARDRLVDVGAPTIVFDDKRPRWHTVPVVVGKIEGWIVMGQPEFPIATVDCPKCRQSWRALGSRLLEDYERACREGHVVVVVETVF